MDNLIRVPKHEEGRGIDSRCCHWDFSLPCYFQPPCGLGFDVACKGAHTRTSLASESGWARVAMSQTRPCVECHEPDFGRLYIYIYIYIYIRAWLPRRTREPDWYVYGHLNTHEHQGYLWGSKGGRCAGLATLPPSCADCLRNYGIVSLL
jgi:hypothetical protein